MKRARNRFFPLMILLLFAARGTAFAAQDVFWPFSWTTGLPTDKPYRPVLVSISNNWDARPAMHLAEADIVYEYIVGGPRHTRYLALYNDEHPAFVCPIRSIRPNCFELREEWDCPMVFPTLTGSNAMQELRKRERDFYEKREMFVSYRLEFHKKSPSSDIFYRSLEQSRKSPNDLCAEIKLFVAQHWPVNQKTNAPYNPRKPLLAFSDTPPEGGDPALHIRIPYHKDYLPEYTFNADKGVYERWYAGGKQFDGATGQRIVASNVIVQYATVWYYKGDLSSPMVGTLGEGRIDAFIGGVHVGGTWKRKALKDKTEFYDEKGAQLTLMPGKTFIQIVPLELVIEYSDTARPV